MFLRCFLRILKFTLRTEILQKDIHEIKYEMKSQIHVAKREKLDIIKIERR